MCLSAEPRRAYDSLEIQERYRSVLILRTSAISAALIGMFTTGIQDASAACTSESFNFDDGTMQGWSSFGTYSASKMTWWTRTTPQMPPPGTRTATAMVSGMPHSPMLLATSPQASCPMTRTATTVMVLYTRMPQRSATVMTMTATV